MGNGILNPDHYDHIATTTLTSIIPPPTNKIQNRIKDEASSVRIIKPTNKDFEDHELINISLSNHFLFKVFDKPLKIKLIKEMSLCFIEKDHVVYFKGDTPQYFYMIKSGTVQSNFNLSNTIGKNNQLTSGDCFGDIDIIYGSSRTSTITAMTDCFFWIITKDTMKILMTIVNTYQKEEIRRLITSHFLFLNLEQSIQKILPECIFKEEHSHNTTLIKTDENRQCIYFIKEGRINCYLNQLRIGSINQNGMFGIKCSITNTPSIMDYITQGRVICYSISINKLREYIGDNINNNLLLGLLKMTFLFSDHLRFFNLKLIDPIFELFSLRDIQHNQIVYPKGYLKSSLFTIILDGNLSPYINNTTEISKCCSILHEKEIIDNDQHEKTNDNILGVSSCLLFEVETIKIIELFGSDIKQLLISGVLIERLHKVNLFQSLSWKIKSEISLKIKEENYSKGATIVKQGEEGTQFFIVKKGTIEVLISDKYMRTINENDYFGERALFFQEPRSASCIAMSDVELFYLDKEDFLSVVQPNMKEHLIDRLFLQDNTISLGDLKFVTQLGAGTYGVATLVYNKKTMYRYAIKSISKKQIDNERLHQSLNLERTILLQIDHPFIVKLVKTLQSTDFIYFLMEYVRGKDLFDVLNDLGTISKKQAQFYCGSLLLAISYLHRMKIIYRDIKPENIIVVNNGYIKLIDFGAAKINCDINSTIIGTPHFMAPEVILGKGYSYQVDYWSCAVCLYEMVCGNAPFGDDCSDPMDIYHHVLQSNLVFPDKVKDSSFKDIMTMMLEKNTSKRLCQIPQIKKHKWFQGFDWEKLIGFNIIPEYLPKIVEEVKTHSSHGMSYIDYVKSNTRIWEPEEYYEVIDSQRLGNQMIYLNF